MWGLSSVLLPVFLLAATPAFAEGDLEKLSEAHEAAVQAFSKDYHFEEDQTEDLRNLFRSFSKEERVVLAAALNYYSGGHKERDDEYLTSLAGKFPRAFKRLLDEGHPVIRQIIKKPVPEGRTPDRFDALLGRGQRRPSHMLALPIISLDASQAMWSALKNEAPAANDPVKEERADGDGSPDTPGGGETVPAFPVDSNNPSVSKPQQVPIDFAVEVVREQPNWPAAHVWHGRAQMQTGRTEDAFKSYERALELGQTDTRTLTEHAFAAQKLGAYDVALRSARRALKLDPENEAAKAIIKLAKKRAPAMDLSSVIDKMREIEEEGGTKEKTGADVRRPEPDVDGSDVALRKSDLLLQQASARYRIKDYFAAIKLASKALIYNPKNAKAFNLRAMAHYKLGDFEKAVADAGRALRLAPGDPASLLTRGRSLNRLQRYEEALSDAESLLAKDPKNAYALVVKAFALAGLRRKTEMLASLERAAVLQPSFRPLYEKAVRLPDGEHLLSLFQDELRLGEMNKPGASRGSRRRPRSSSVVAALALAAVGAGLAAVFFSPAKRARLSTPLREWLTKGHSARGELEKKFDLIREIGRGGMGVVYEAHDKVLDRRVAIKKMRDEIRLDTRERERFLSEARTVAKLRHAGIVEIYSVIEEGRDAYLVFEYVEGETLSDVLGDSERLPFSAARKILKDACEAVAYAHSHGVIHRDLKPSNIMLAGNGAVKVMDFGIARQAKDSLARCSTIHSVAGTPPYMAPEQEQGSTRRESDVYALGVCFYEMLTGKLPFSGQGAGLALNKLKGSFPPASESGADGIPKKVDQALLKALSPDPTLRYRSPVEFSRALFGA